MKKILFVGIERFFLQGMLRNLSEDSPESINDFLANNHADAVEIARTEPGIDTVLFLGHIAVGNSANPFLANVRVAIELKEILAPEAIMVAATGHDRADKELLENGCSVWLSFDKVTQWLRAYVR